MSITSILKVTKNPDFDQPYLHSSNIETGGDHCPNNGKKHIKAFKGYTSASYARNNVYLVKSCIKKDTNEELSFSLHDGPDRLLITGLDWTTGLLLEWSI